MMHPIHQGFLQPNRFQCTRSQPPAMGSRQGTRHLLSTYVHHTTHKKKLQLSVLETHLCHFVYEMGRLTLIPK